MQSWDLSFGMSLVCHAAGLTDAAWRISWHCMMPCLSDCTTQDRHTAGTHDCNLLCYLSVLFMHTHCRMGGCYREDFERVGGGSGGGDDEDEDDDESFDEDERWWPNKATHG